MLSSAVGSAPGSNCRVPDAAVGSATGHRGAGDSLTDEYQFYGRRHPDPSVLPGHSRLGMQAPSPQHLLTGRDTARNFVEQIGATLSSQLSFGNFTTTSRGMTRNQGYQENWAENGTTASGPDVSGTATTFAEEYNGIPPSSPRSRPHARASHADQSRTSRSARSTW